mgnify:CR=1 FL=1
MMSNEARFTKGRWVVSSDSGYSGHTVLRNDTGYGVCQTVLREEQDLINAHLIAAAPEMYEMLESIYESKALNGEDDDVMNEIKAILAKARGGK